jgi:LPXTG-motif cell wall-anchored protein
MILADAQEDGGPQPESASASTLPRTASNTPAIALIGLLALGTALVLRKVTAG